MDDDYPIDPALDFMFVLVAELLKAGTLDQANVASMARRLRMADLDDIADRLHVLHYSNEADHPTAFRAGFAVIDGGQPDGGNSAD